MSNYTKGRPYGWSRTRYLTRKDWYHRKVDFGWSWCSKRKYKKQSNEVVRRYKHKIPDGGSYKKLYDLDWICF